MISTRKKYYTFSEVSKIVGESCQLLRSWEKELKLKIPEKLPNRKSRKYQIHHIKTFQKVKKLLRVNKYSLKGIAKLVKGKRDNPALHNILADLRKFKRELEDLRDSITTQNS